MTTAKKRNELSKKDAVLMDSDLKTLVTAVQGERLMGEPSQKFQGVSINTRTLKPGELFFCIQGDQFDGHAFLNDAAKKKRPAW